jgi:hypothetical protein
MAKKKPDPKKSMTFAARVAEEMNLSEEELAPYRKWISKGERGFYPQQVVINLIKKERKEE